MQQPILEVNYTIDMERDWNVDYAYKGYGFAVKRPNGGTVCTLPNGLRPEEKQLAQLISAAPEMFQTLKNIVAMYDEIYSARLFTIEECKVLRAARIAIAKTQGERNV